MSNLEKPLYTLSVEEFTQLNRQIVRQQLEEFNFSQTDLKQKPDQDIIFIEEACELTGYSKATMYSKISRYEIPVLSRGKPLTFSKKELIQWIHDGKPNVIENIEATNFFKSPKS